MSQRKKKARSKRPPNRSRSRALRSVARETEPDPLDVVAELLDDPSPLALLQYVSGIVDVADERNRDPFHPDEPAPTLDQLVTALSGMPSRETSATLTAMTVLVRDELLIASIRRELAARSFSLPDWLVRLRDAQPSAPLQRGHVLRDGENVVIGATIPGAPPISASVFIDHNLGGVAKDAYPVPASVVEVDEILARVEDDPDLTTAWLAPADARARVTDAIAAGARTYPPYETDTWPGSRPLVEWMCSLLPPGGVGIELHEWSEDEERAVAQDFFRSEHGMSFGEDSDSASRLESLLWYGTGYSTGDPYRWSVPKLEVLLLDWIPRKIMATPDYLAPFPDLIRAFVAFGHEHVGVPARLTTEAHAAIDDFEPEFSRLIADASRPQGVDALFDAMGLSTRTTRATLADEVGGEDQLAALDSRPLPDEAFDDHGIAPHAVERVRAISRLIDPVAERTFGIEARTACRRLLRRVALADPSVILRGKRDEITAGAICWMIGLNNELFDGRTLVRDLLAQFNVTGSVSQRADAMRASLGLGAGQIALGAADLLVSSARDQICRLRDDDWS